MARNPAVVPFVLDPGFLPRRRRPVAGDRMAFAGRNLVGPIAGLFRHFPE